jgi:hypothetical protein
MASDQSDQWQIQTLARKELQAEQQPFVGSMEEVVSRTLAFAVGYVILVHFTATSLGR